MQQAVSARTPAHLWIVGVLATLWNAYGCYQYLMTNMKNQAFVAQIPADQLTYIDGLPSWRRHRIVPGGALGPAAMA